MPTSTPSSARTPIASGNSFSSSPAGSVRSRRTRCSPRTEMRRAAHAALLSRCAKSGLCSPPMRLLLALALLKLGSALAQEKPAAPPAAKEESASGGATAPRPSSRRDAGSSRALFDRLDKNHDGYLTGTELTSQEALSTNWLGVDRDGDGRISRKEFTAVNPPETARR